MQFWRWLCVPTVQSPFLELICIPHASESPPATHVLSLITHTSLVIVLLIVPPNNCLKVCPFSSFYIGLNALWGGGGLISIIRSYFVTLLLVYSPPTILEFLKCKRIISHFYTNSISEFSLSLAFLYCTLWNHHSAYYRGGGCNRREEEQVRLWIALLRYVLWHPNESLWKRKKKWYSYWENRFKSMAHKIKHRCLNVLYNSFHDWSWLVF